MAAQTDTPKRPSRKRASSRKPANTAPRGPKQSWVRRHLLGVTIAALVLLTVIGVAVAIGLTPHRGQEQWVFVPRDASEQQIADTLQAHLGESMARRVMLLWRMQGGTPSSSHGAYRIPSGQTALRISRNIARGQQTPVNVTFNSCRTLDQLAARVASQLEMSPDDFVSACSDVLPPLGYSTPAMYPAAFIPDTYQFYWSSPAPDVVKRLADERNKFWTQERRDQAAAMGLNPVKVATVASIVEEETAKADERPLVARLYLNRLNKNMKLQADPTVKYALGDFALRRITVDHINRAVSPYNTYLNPGLPPGPIRIVDRQTLLDVLNAPQHPYIYMCAKEDFSGYHNFAVDYDTHLANARRYQAELNRRGIK